MVKIINDKILNALGTDKVPRVLVGNKKDLSHERSVLFSLSFLLNVLGFFFPKKNCFVSM
jgi:GTPase SAR1 family protein